jgi:hypothetical protein
MAQFRAPKIYERTAMPNVLRATITALIAAFAYWLLLWANYTLMSGFYILQGFPQGPIQVVAWFTLINAAAVALAAVPLGLALRRWGLGLSKPWAISVGAAIGAYIVGSGLIEYGPSRHLTGLVVDALQFVLIGVAPLLALTLNSNHSGSSLQRSKT